MPKRKPERRCRICGCTDARGCPEGCGWDEDDPLPDWLCTVCAAFKRELEGYVLAASRVSAASLARLLKEVADV